MAESWPEKTPCAKIRRNEGEGALRLIRKMGLSDEEHKIQSRENMLYLPLVRQPNETEWIFLRTQYPALALETATCPKKNVLKKTLRCVLENRLQPSLLASLPRAIDIVGDIAIIEIPPALKKQERLVGRAILETNRKVKTVLAKASAIAGTYRLRELKFIAGEQKTNTIHKEYGCTFAVDLARAYFSPRLSQEHKRIASLTQKDETVIDLFAGVGPFAILISKTNPDTKVHAIDINPEAIRLLETNARLNRVEHQVFPVLGDATKIVEEKLAGSADRVIMNLPEKAIDFLGTACKAGKSAGCTVHVYSFANQTEKLEDVQKRFYEEVEKAGRRVDRILSTRTVRETAPHERQVVLDARIV